MESPFPGMDPYLEQFWLDAHSRIVLYACDQLEEQLPPSLIARVEERVLFETDAPYPQARYPDVKITARRGGRNGGVAVMERTDLAEPVIVECEPKTETFINILEAGPGQRLVTVIEVLSMSNKQSGERQDEYRAKQSELRSAGVSLVEIDLLRAGDRVLNVPWSLVRREHRTTYLACVHRGWASSRYELYPMPLQMRLPSIRIPLRRTDDDIRLDLQAVVDQAYRKGRYRLSIDYKQQPNPPLIGADGKWVKTLLRATSKKKRK